MEKKEFITSIKDIKTPSEELELLAALSKTDYWVVVKRWVERYQGNLMRSSFNLDMRVEGHRFLHAGYLDQDFALSNLIQAVEGSDRRLREMGSKKEEKGV